MDDRKQLKLCGFNVHNLGRADNCDDATYRSKLDYLTDVFGMIDADVVVVDEVREPDSFDELADRLERYGHRFLADAPDGTRRIQIGILSKLPVLEQGQWREFPAALPGRSGEVIRLRFRRAMPWIRVELPNEETLFLTAVHLKSRRAAVEETPEELPMRARRVLGRSLAWLIRTSEAAGLRLLLDEVMDRRTADHCCVVGDFNDTPHSQALSLVMGLEDEEGSDLAASEARRLYQVAWQTPPDRAFSYVGRGQRCLFDNILVSQRLSLKLDRARVESQLLEAERRYSAERGSGYPRSDHAPVWASFDLGS
jgi:endonuclease/exonuclease/phosphatase family metal-dependent hydrolase